MSSVIEEKKGKNFLFKSHSFLYLFSFFFLVFSLFFFLYYPKRGVKIPEWNVLTRHSLFAKVPFSFLDRKATALKRESLLKKSGTLYKISSTDLQKTVAELNQFFVSQNSLQEQRESFAQILDKWESKLRDLRYYLPIEGLHQITAVPSLSQSLRNLHFEPMPKLPFLSAEGKFCDFFKELAQEETSFLKEPLLSSLSAHLKSTFWNLEEDLSQVEGWKRSLQKSILPVYVHYEVGDLLVEKGERITSRHQALLQTMQSALCQEKDLHRNLFLVGALLLSLILTSLLINFLCRQYDVLSSCPRQLILILFLFGLILFLTRGVEYLFSSLPLSWSAFVRFPLFLPLISLLLHPLVQDKRVIVLLQAILFLLFSIAPPFEEAYFPLLNFSCSLATLLSMDRHRKRNKIFSVIVKQILFGSLFLLALNFFNCSFSLYNWLQDVFCISLSMGVLGILALGLVPLLEVSFSILTDAMLAEYLDPNHPLLRRLSVEAPGTYHHSLLVAHLAESAALAIGADALFCRAASMYHDIGKLHNPQYYWENRQKTMNIHELLSAEESSKAIIRHVFEGVQLAKREKLPVRFIDIICEHHGTTLAYYFYHKFCEEEKIKGVELHREIREKNFRYSGPIPQSKEAVIIMIADSVEAASRALEEINEETIRCLVSGIIRERETDKQFCQAPITFRELNEIEDNLVQTLLTANHSRIKYPSKSGK